MYHLYFSLSLKSNKICNLARVAQIKACDFCMYFFSAWIYSVFFPWEKIYTHMYVTLVLLPEYTIVMMGSHSKRNLCINHKAPVCAMYCVCYFFNAKTLVDHMTISCEFLH